MTHLLRQLIICANLLVSLEKCQTFMKKKNYSLNQPKMIKLLKLLLLY
jgi:hypothetical protein